jgi:hypothetical protein
MIARRFNRLLLLCLAVTVFFAVATEVRACSVCFGDPESPMAKGFVWGVLVLVAIVGCVLSAIAGIAVFWMCRGRRLAQCDSATPAS